MSNQRIKELEAIIDLLYVLLNIEQKFIDEYPLNRIEKIRTVDLRVFNNLLNEILQQEADNSILQTLETYRKLLEKIWYRAS